MHIYQTAHFKVRGEALGICEQAIREFIAYVKETETGTLLYESWQQVDDSTSFVHNFIFESEEARQIHRTSAGVMRFTSTLYPHLLAPVEFTDYTLLATTA